MSNNRIYLNGFSLLLIVGVTFFLIPQADAAKPELKAIPIKREKCVVRLDNKEAAHVAIGMNGTVLNFPVKPKEAILARANSFGAKYVESDIELSPFGSSSTSNLYVYLEGRRFTFVLTTTPVSDCPVILVRDAKDTLISVDSFFRNKK